MTLMTRFRDWWRGYTESEWLSMMFKYRTKCRFPEDFTSAEQRAFMDLD